MLKRVLLAAALALVAAWLLLMTAGPRWAVSYLNRDDTALRARLAAMLSERIGDTVTIAFTVRDARLGWDFNLHAALDGLKIESDRLEELNIDVTRAAVDLPLVTCLLGRGLVIDTVRIHMDRLRVVRTADGRWMPFAAFAAQPSIEDSTQTAELEAAGTPPVVHGLDVTIGVLAVRPSPTDTELTFSDVRLALRQEAGGGGIDIQAAAVNGAPFPLKATGRLESAPYINVRGTVSAGPGELAALRLIPAGRVSGRISASGSFEWKQTRTAHLSVSSPQITVTIPGSSHDLHDVAAEADIVWTDEDLAVENFKLTESGLDLQAKAAARFSHKASVDLILALGDVSFKNFPDAMARAALESRTLGYERAQGSFSFEWQGGIPPRGHGRVLPAIRLDALRFDARGAPIIQAATIGGTIQFPGGTQAVGAPLTLGLGGSRIEITGDLSEPLNLRIHTPAPVDPAAAGIQPSALAAGLEAAQPTVTADLWVSGSMDKPKLKGGVTLAAERVTWKGLNAGRVALPLRFADDRFTGDLTGLLLAGELSAALNGSVGSKRAGVEGRLRGAQLSELNPLLAEKRVTLSGRADAQVDLDELGDSPALWSGTVKIQAAPVSVRGVPTLNELTKVLNDITQALKNVGTGEGGLQALLGIASGVTGGSAFDTRATTVFDAIDLEGRIAGGWFEWAGGSLRSSEMAIRPAGRANLMTGDLQMEVFVEFTDTGLARVESSAARTILAAGVSMPLTGTLFAPAFNKELFLKRAMRGVAAEVIKDKLSDIFLKR